MEITTIRIRLVQSRDEKLKAFACVLLDDCFVIRDIKIISRPNGLFVAMPSRKLTFCCPRCTAKNHLRSNYCNHCGGRLTLPNPGTNGRGRAKLYADIAHPITSHCRDAFHKKVLAAYEEEVVRSRQPGYAPTPAPNDLDEPGVDPFDDFAAEETPGPSSPPA